MEKNLKKTLIISGGFILLLMLIGTIWYFVFKEEDSQGNFQKEFKTFYVYQDTSRFLLQEEIPSSKDYQEYTCKTTDCEQINLTSELPFFLIYDGEYLLLSAKNNSLVYLDLKKDDIKKVSFKDIYIVIEDNENNTKFYNVLTNSETKEKKEIQNMQIEENYIIVYYEDLSRDVYNLEKSKFILQDSPALIRSFTEKYLIFTENEKWSVYSLLDDKIVLERNFLTYDGFINVLEGDEHSYIYSSYAWNYEEPIEIYNEKLELLSDKYYVRGKTKEDSLVVTESGEPFIVGGNPSKSYYSIKDFRIIDFEQNKIYRSKKYKSLINFVSSSLNGVEYFFAVDEKNMLNMYDINEKLLVPVIEWEEGKKLCTVGTISGQDVIKFSVSLTADTSMHYEYNVKTNTLKEEYKEVGVCTK